MAIDDTTDQAAGRPRVTSRKFGRSLVHDLKHHADNWLPVDGALVRGDGNLIIVLVPRRFRIFDSVYVQINGVDVWLPFFKRRRVRKLVRFVATEHACEFLS